MVPAFPVFKPLELSDQRLIDKRNIHGYSDFAFASLWCWNTKDDFSISVLNKNLVVKMRDYLNHEPILTFLGGNNLSDTIYNLLYVSRSIGQNSLHLVPEDNLNENKIIFEEYFLDPDRNQFDYIYPVKEISLLSGGKYHKKRHLAIKFEKKYNPEIKLLDLRRKYNQRQIVYVLHKWLDKRNKSYKDYREEAIAIQKAFMMEDKMISLGIFVENELAAFNMGEMYSNKISMILFQKTDPTYSGITEYLMKKTCELYFKKGALYLNFMQDVGEPGLRMAKNLWRPVKFLKKYKIYPKT